MEIPLIDASTAKFVIWVWEEVNVHVWVWQMSLKCAAHNEGTALSPGPLLMLEEMILCMYVIDENVHYTNVGFSI